MFIEKIKNYNIKLASKSPRRHYLLKQAGINFEIVTNKEVEENYPPETPLKDVPQFLAKKKASVYIEDLERDDILITADTIVICNNQILGKPSDKNHAIEMLSMQSGNSHTVITGVCISNPEKQHAFNAVTEVFFKELSMDEINYYIENFSPFDKAGAYGIQEWIGHIGVEKIEGSFFNVMGLPIQKLYDELDKFIQ